MSHFIEQAEVILESALGAPTRRHTSINFDPMVTTQSHLDSDAGTVGVFYSSGGIGRYFFARMPFCK